MRLSWHPGVVSKNECHTAALSDLRTRLERKEDDGPRKLLMPERVERLKSKEIACWH
jgi:hypothetical protein